MGDNEQTSYGTCRLNIPSNVICNGECRKKQAVTASFHNCLAIDKLLSFSRGEGSLNFSYTVFAEKVPFPVLNSLCIQNEDVFRQVQYFLKISNPYTIKNITDNLENEILYRILSSDYHEYFIHKSEIINENPSFFCYSQNKFWTYLSVERQIQLIEFLIHKKEDIKLAAIFLLILPEEVCSDLKIKACLNEEEEKRLYFALEDDIFYLASESPDFYYHLMDLFADSPEVTEVFKEFDELAKEKKAFKEIKDELIQIRAKQDVFYLQYLLDALKHMMYASSLKLLEYLKSKKAIHYSENIILQEFVEKREIARIEKEEKRKARKKNHTPLYT